MAEENLTTIASLASVLENLLDHYGLDKREIARQIGIDTDITHKPDDRVSVASMQKFWTIVHQRTGDDCLGISYAELIQPASLCGLGLAWITSDTLKDSIQRLIRFQHALTTAVDFSLVEHDESYRVILQTRLKNPVSVSMDASLAVLFRMCLITYGPELEAQRVCLSHPEPDCTDRFNSFFGREVEFDTDETQLVFSKKTFDRKLASSNPELARMSDNVVIEYLKRFDKKNISLQVRAHIIESLNNGVPHQEKIASSLNMSLRSLQRKLKEQNTSFKAILDDTRCELSKQYLRGSERSIIEIGFLLGFTESSNFSRAFRRWTGVSPHEYRKRAE